MNIDRIDFKVFLFYKTSDKQKYFKVLLQSQASVAMTTDTMTNHNTSFIRDCPEDIIRVVQLSCIIKIN